MQFEQVNVSHGIVAESGAVKIRAQMFDSSSSLRLGGNDGTGFKETRRQIIELQEFNIFEECVVERGLERREKGCDFLECYKPYSYIGMRGWCLGEAQLRVVGKHVHVRNRGTSVPLRGYSLHIHSAFTTMAQW